MAWEMHGYRATTAAMFLHAELHHLALTFIYVYAARMLKIVELKIVDGFSLPYFTEVV